MRIACLQFNPQVGDVDNNLNRADAVLSRANPKNIDLLVLPELAFSGYNFTSLEHISPYLEPTASGITSLWARTTALKHNCVVTVGYPEKVDASAGGPAILEYYNSAVTVNKEGETIANYRKSFLYYTDETWAHEGPDGFFDGEVNGLGNVAMGICKWPTKSFERMDLNPYKFEAPWSAWEFAYHVLHKQANLVVLSMAWLTREDPRSYSRLAKEPDMDTLSYWLARLEPIIRAESKGEIIVVLANRCGNEGQATYAGTSAVLGIEDGEVRVYGILGRGEKELLVVDTNKRPKAKLVSEPNSTASDRASTNTGLKAPSTKTRSRTNSTASSRPSMDTLSTAVTTPSSAITMNDVAMNDIPTPISAANSSYSDFKTPRALKPTGDTLRDNLESIFGEDKAKHLDPKGIQSNRPASTKSRNASRSPTAHNFSRPLTPTKSPTTERQGRSREPLPNTSFHGASHSVSPTSSRNMERQGRRSISRSVSPPAKKYKQQKSNNGMARSILRSPSPKIRNALLDRKESQTYIGPSPTQSPKSSRVSSPQDLPRIDTQSASPRSPKPFDLFAQDKPVLVNTVYQESSEVQKSNTTAVIEKDTEMFERLDVEKMFKRPTGQTSSSAVSVPQEKAVVDRLTAEQLFTRPAGQTPTSSTSAPDEHHFKSPFFSTGTVFEPRSSYVTPRPLSTQW